LFVFGWLDSSALRKLVIRFPTERFGEHLRFRNAGKASAIGKLLSSAGVEAFSKRQLAAVEPAKSAQSRANLKATKRKAPRNS